MSYKQIKEMERDEITKLINRGWSIRRIGRCLCRSASSISREISRNYGRKRYSPHKAQYRANERKRNSHKRDRLKSHALRIEVEKLISQGWSPEIISGRIKKRSDLPDISHEAIYQWIYDEAPDLIHYLPRKHKQRKKKGKYRKSRKILIPNRVPIEQRPEVINERKEIGHWETDLVIGRGRNVLQVCVERKSRYTCIKRIDNKTAHKSQEAVVELLMTIPKDYRRTITYDNGRENTNHTKVNKLLGTESYFCQPYHSWEKGTVENTNGLIRRFIPKKTNFDNIKEEEIRQVEEWLNNRPRKCLNYYTPKEVFELGVALTP